MTDDSAQRQANQGITLLADVRLAVAFLTRLPLPPFMDSRPLAGAAWAFPVAGAMVGGIGAAVVSAAAWAQLHPLACAFLGVAAMVLTSGALHEDGLADVADGFGASPDRNVKLAVMHDSRIGTYGVIALVFSLGLRAALIAGLQGPGTAGLALLAAAMAGRGAMPSLMAALPPARADGLSKGAGRPGVRGVAVALLIGFGAAAVLGYRVLGPNAALAGVLGGAVGAVAMAVIAKRQIGGQTGDVLGAAAQLTEIGVLIGWAANG